MLELKQKPADIDGVTPYLYHKWYCGKSNTLRYIEYGRRPAAILRAMQEKPGMRVLDLGCDWGYLLMCVKDRFPGASCVGVDISDQNVSFGNELAKLNGYDIDCRYGNALKLDFEDGFFDYVISTESFEHFFLDDRLPIIKECCRVLKPSGRLLLTTPNKYGLAEITKQSLGRISLFKKLIPMLPTRVDDKGYSPGGATKGDKMTNIAESLLSLKAKLEDGGFKVAEQKAFIFVPEVTPNFLLPLAKSMEFLIEFLWVFNFLATTQFVKAVKR